MKKDFVTKKRRMTKKKMGAEFKLADSDDFFGFDGKEQESWMVWMAIITVASALFVFGWVVIGNAQQSCLDRNEGNITLCE